MSSNMHEDFYDLTLEEQEHAYDVEHIHAGLVMNSLATEVPYEAGMNHIRAALAFMLNHTRLLSHKEVNNVAALNLMVTNMDPEHAASQNERDVWH